MTTAFAALLIGVAGAAFLLALIAYLWINRVPSTDERFDEYGRVPLFGVDLTAVNTAEPQSDAAALDDVEQSASADETPGVHQAAVRHDGHPVGQPIFVDSSALGATNGVNGTTPTSGPAIVESAKTMSPRDDKRVGGRGWGDAPGWPVEPAPLVQAPTPKYVPPIVPPAKPPLHVVDGPNNGANYRGEVAGQEPHGSVVEGHRIRFSTPAEGTLQFLPGRLEISSGLDTGREIRFVRVPGPNGTEVTFGRNEGALYRHIQLRDQTVSREHARMTFIGGRWILTNLSKTNPVAHNGRVLQFAEQQALEDGDRLEMGEVVFSFRSR